MTDTSKYQPRLRCTVGVFNGCDMDAVGNCPAHGNACIVHSRFKMIGPRECDTCRGPLGPAVRPDPCLRSHKFEKDRMHCLEGCGTLFEPYAAERVMVYAALEQSAANGFPPDSMGTEALLTDIMTYHPVLEHCNPRDIRQHIRAWRDETAGLNRKAAPTLHA